ncbi:intracellular protein transport protein USO1-like [Notolabrus celidotus]|uniref:intracellular protein transport protein USO1-like n=1 Tax=Notolabrus celidotus TaxID=1203425 RepID=UPI00148FED55|nr:intracellular protein transport protein USO1-like [Notolabrus celidotus]
MSHFNDYDLTSEQQVDSNNMHMGEMDSLRRENRRLERSNEELEKKLLKTKKLKDVYIERSKVQRRELDKLNFYDGAGNLNKEEMSTLINSKFKHSHFRNLEEDYEELQVGHMLSQQALKEELQLEKDKCRILQEELNETKLSYLNISSRYDTEVPALRQQAGFFLHELENEKQSHADRVLEDQRHMDDMRAENDALHQKMAQDFNDLQQSAFERERDLLNELEELKIQLSLQKLCQQENQDMKKTYTISQERFAAELQLQNQKNKVLQEERESLTVSYNDLNQRYETVISTVQQQADVIQSNEDRMREYLRVISEQKAEQDALQKEIAEEVSKTEKEEEVPSQMETTSCQEEPLPEALTAKVQEEAEESKEQTSEEETSDRPAMVGLQQEEAEAVNTTQHSFWKRFRHALGLRKPKRWKKKNVGVHNSPAPSL